MKGGGRGGGSPRIRTVARWLPQGTGLGGATHPGRASRTHKHGGAWTDATARCHDASASPARSTEAPPAAAPTARLGCARSPHKHSPGLSSVEPVHALTLFTKKAKLWNILSHNTKAHETREKSRIYEYQSACKGKVRARGGYAAHKTSSHHVPDCTYESLQHEGARERDYGNYGHASALHKGELKARRTSCPWPSTGACGRG